MWEVSTPFVYMRWFLYTFGKSETKFYIVNGLLMVSTFFIFRNIMGVGAPPSHALPYPELLLCQD